MAALRHARLLIDILSIELLVRLFGQDGELLDSHLFFYDRYSDLAAYHRRRGRVAKADRFAAIADAHYRAAPGDDDPPEAAAMAMPAPRPLLKTNAMSRVTLPEAARPRQVREPRGLRAEGSETRSSPQPSAV